MGQGEQQQQQPGASAPAACRHTACIIFITSCFGLRLLCCGCVAAAVLPLSLRCLPLCAVVHSTYLLIPLLLLLLCRVVPPPL